MNPINPEIKQLLKDVEAEIKIYELQIASATETRHAEISGAALESEAFLINERLRAIRERMEELQDALHPELRAVDEAGALEIPEFSPASANGLAIMVGHTRRSPGATGQHPPMPAPKNNSEYYWNEDLAQKIKTIADRNGIRCRIFYRDGLSIAQAYRPVKKWKPQATIELHFNAANEIARGAETWYGNSTNSKQWAQKLQDGMVVLYGLTGKRDRGIKDARSTPPYRAKTSVTQIYPSALLEPFFGDNVDDALMGERHKDGLARVVVEAYAVYVNISLGQQPARREPMPDDEDIVLTLPEKQAYKDLRVLYLKPSTKIEFPHLKFITLAQWALESGWGSSKLSIQHLNFGGMKGNYKIAHILHLATTVRYRAHDGWDKYLRFHSLENFIKGYWLFLDRPPYDGWRSHTSTPEEFIGFIASKWAPVNPNYANQIINLAKKIKKSVEGKVTAPPSVATGTFSDLNLPDNVDHEFRRLFEMYGEETVEFDHLKAVSFAQWALESNWGHSSLATRHFNFSGIDWLDDYAGLATSVPHPSGNQARGQYCRFPDFDSFIAAYWQRFDIGDDYSGWKAHTTDAQTFMAFIAPRWRPGNASYRDDVLGVLSRIQGVTPVVTRPVADGEFIFQVNRSHLERRNGRGKIRTASHYEVFYNGASLGLKGMIFEPAGPGNNTRTGVARGSRIKQGKYPLYTHSGSIRCAGGTIKYKTYNYSSSSVDYSCPRPSVRLGRTGARRGILFHPASGYLNSIGCQNLSRPLSGDRGRINYSDSRRRVIAVIDKMKEVLGSRFPSSNSKRIPNAYMVLSGEPMNYGTEAQGLWEGVLGADRAVSERATEARTLVAQGLEINNLPSHAAFDLLGAVINGEGLAEKINEALFLEFLDGETDITAIRNHDRMSLWQEWAIGWENAYDVLDLEKRNEILTVLDQIANRLLDAGLPLDDNIGLHTPLTMAAKADLGEAVSKLIALGAKVDKRDNLGFTPLLAGVAHGAESGVVSLLKNGADTTVTMGDLKPGYAANEEEAIEFSESRSVGCQEGSTALQCAQNAKAMIGEDDEEGRSRCERIIELLQIG